MVLCIDHIKVICDLTASSIKIKNRQRDDRISTKRNSARHSLQFIDAIDASPEVDKRTSLNFLEAGGRWRHISDKRYAARPSPGDPKVGTSSPSGDGIVKTDCRQPLTMALQQRE